MKLGINLRTGDSIVVNDFTHVNYGTDNIKTVKAENLSNFNIYSVTYNFVGNKESITVSGPDILYLQLLNE